MSTDDLDPEWQQTLRRFRMRGIEQRRAERKDPKLREERLNAERRRIIDSARTELKRFGVPEMLIDELSGRVIARETQAMAVLREWKEQRKSDRSLWAVMLSGDTGRGKDFAFAKYFHDEACDRARRGDSLSAIAECWFSCPILITKAFTKYGVADPVVTDALSRMSVLVLEDLGAEAPDKAGKWLSWLFGVLNERHKNRRVTFITTNLNREEFRERYGKRIISRLATGGRFVEITGPNLRRPGAAEKLPPAGHKAPEQLPLSSGKRTVRPAQYRVRYRPLSPRAQARRRQLELRFA